MSSERGSAEPSAALIGDLVDSRGSVDRRRLHRRVQTALAAVNARLSPRVPLWITAGDEFQGRFDAVGEALAASVLIRIELLPEIDVRQGIGWGQVQVLSQRPRVEDGGAWWAARAALEAVEASEAQAALRGVRTSIRVAEDSGSEATAGLGAALSAGLEAALMTRDQLVSGLSPRGLSVLRGLLSGQTQGQIATREGISASAVSQRVRADGLAVLVRSHELLQTVGRIEEKGER